MYAFLCDFVCIALLLPFVLGFCLSVLFIFYFFWLYSFQCLLSLVDLFFGLVALFFLSFFIFNNYFLFLILITLFYFILFLLSFFFSLFPSEPCG